MVVEGVHIDESSDTLRWANKKIFLRFDRHEGMIALHKGHYKGHSKGHSKKASKDIDVSSDASSYGYVISTKHTSYTTTDIQRWHERLGHPGTEVLEHAMERNLGVRIKGVKTTDCQTYSLSKAQRIISRQPQQIRVTAARAHIGYLVGHKSSTQYLMWVPQLGKVIDTSNVTFDEKNTYKTMKPTAEKEEVEETVEQLQVHRIRDDNDDVDIFADIFSITNTTDPTLLMSDRGWKD
ncbi:unnamed protein product [Parascedosporium putredinis]|uniref:GAG-pre-integrase domain-containing protein n=1 Tax=Parascedosporium putredinis TaxID=1442378 RepID=A0A9P1H0R0_9PEZI|nr:unnamed protein product [Parascedosporium putredinis]CAI7991973.1 unnamed protein product [Parascedosporium putredinis]